MGKRIIQQARGKGSLTYRTKKKAFRISISYPSVKGTGKIVKLINTACYSAPLAKIEINGRIFYNIAAKGVYEGQRVDIGQGTVAVGNILPLGKLPIGTFIYNIETIPGAGPKLVRTSGLTAKITKKEKNKVVVALPSKKEKAFDVNARASIGVVAAAGRTEKPLLKAGKMFHMKKAIGGRIYPRTSAVKMNVVDHPFGSGRGKRIKAKIAKRDAPPGKKVGLLSPRKTGKKK